LFSSSFLRATFGRTASGVLASLTVLLAACGGGGGGASTSASVAPDAPAASFAAAGEAIATAPTRTFASAASLAGICTLEGQKSYVRSFLHESYLWYDEIKDVDAAKYSTVTGYFDALLVRTPTASGAPRDQFSSIRPSSEADYIQGVARAGIPAVGTDLVASGNVMTTTGGRKVGYVLFNEHIQGAQDKLIGVFEGLKTAGVQDVVLDLRYNPGGFLYVAQTLASMVASPQAAGQTFERLRYNDKRDADSAANAFLYTDRVLTAETVFPKGHLLPKLSLPRLYVLSSNSTCSASESIVNGLRGIGIDVVLIGNTTCGKPYGYARRDNCGQALFAIEFQVYNAQGFGDYAAGFQPRCKVVERPETAWSLNAGLRAGLLGSASEPLLAAALKHIDFGVCPAGTAVGVEISTDPAAAEPDMRLQPGWNGRRLLP
jgi:hypothetical protein